MGKKILNTDWFKPVCIIRGKKLKRIETQFNDRKYVRRIEGKKLKPICI